MSKSRKLVLEDHDIAYMEMGDPLWFVIGFSDKGKSLDIIVVSGRSEEEARARVGMDSILRCTQLYSLLDRARVTAGFIKAINTTGANED